MKKMLLCSYLVVAMALAAAAADVTGKWSGSFTPEGGQPGTAYAILKQSGTALTGSAGPDESQQWPDLKGTIHGDKVTVEVKSTSDGTVYKCDLVLEGDHLKGDVSATAGGGGGQALKAKMDLARVK
jgi:opacity protein-like surface antigen